MKTLRDLKKLLAHGETVVAYSTTENCYSKNYILATVNDNGMDVMGAIESTLHRVRAEGWGDDDIRAVLGLYKIGADESLEDIEQSIGCVYIDLDYIVLGYIISVKY